MKIVKYEFGPVDYDGVFGLGSFANKGALSDELTGRQIMDESSSRHDRDVELEIQKMTLRTSDAVEEVRRMWRYVRKEDEAFKYLMVFDEPAGVSGVALLTWENLRRRRSIFISAVHGKKLKNSRKVENAITLWALILHSKILCPRAKTNLNTKDWMI